MKKITSFLKKNLVIVSLVLMVGVMAMGFLLIRRTQKELKVIEVEIKAKFEEIQKYETSKENAPSPALIARLQAEQDALQNQFSSLLRRFSTTYPSIPEFKVFPAVEYKEFLLETDDILHKKARKNNVIIPTSFGFQETGFPAVDQIPLFSLQITVIRNMLDLLIDAGVSIVNGIVPGVPSTVAFYKILPLDVSITGNSIEIVRFLKYLNNPSSFFTLESFAIAKSGSDLFSASLKINAVMISPETVNPPATPVAAAPAVTAPPAAAAPGQPGGGPAAAVPPGPGGPGRQ